MRLINYEPVLGKYIPFSVMEGLKAEARGRVLNVDKLITGNGATTYFLETKPELGKICILVEANVSVCEGKRGSRDENGKLKYQDGFVYLYGTSPNTTRDINIFTTHIVTTVDTFRGGLIPYLKEKGLMDRIETVVLDEAHKVSTDSRFRKSMVDFYTDIEEVANRGASVITITASPNVFDTLDDRSRFFVDVQLVPSSGVEQKQVCVTHSEKQLVEEIVERRSKGQRCLVFTNSLSIISQFFEDRTLKAKLIVGNTIAKKVMSVATVEEDENFVICSSAAYEGHDLTSEGWHIYLFSDGSNENLTISVVGLYQALGRARKGWSTATVCETPPKLEYDKWGNVRRELSALEVLEKVRFEQPEDLLSSRVFKASGIYDSFKRRKVQRNIHVSYNGHDPSARIIWEQVLADHDSVVRSRLLISDSYYRDWFEARGITFSEGDLSDVSSCRSRARRTSAETFIEANIRDVERLKLHEDTFSPALRESGSKALISAFWKEWELHCIIRRAMGVHENSREEILTGMGADGLDELVKTVKEIMLRGKREELRNTPRRDSNRKNELRAKINQIRTTSHYDRAVLRVVGAIVNDIGSIAIKGFTLINREYSAITELSAGAIEYIYRTFGITFEELDIRSCAWRVVYALAGKELPCQFYGENKEKKKSKNILLNTLSLAKGENRRDARKARIKRLTRAGIDPDVINWLVDYAIDRPPNAVVNLYSYHEKSILKDIQDKAYISADWVFRRHDSLILANGFVDWKELCDYEYRGVGGWFEECDNWDGVSLI